MKIFRALLVNGNSFMQSLTFMAKKEIFKKVGLFDEERFSSSRDLAMWLRILEKYPVGILDDILVSWRNEGKSKGQYLYTERADFFNVMDFYLYKKMLAKKIEEKLLRHYQYQKRFDDTLRAMNFLIKGEEKKAKEMIAKKVTIGDFMAFLEKISVRKIQSEALRAALAVGIKLNLSKHLKNILYKIRYGGIKPAL